MADALTPFEALCEAYEIAGSQPALAAICGVTQGTVSKWLNKSKRLPPEHVIPVEAATGVSRHLLRPDIYPLLPREGEDPGEDCGAILAKRDPAVAFDRETETKLSGTSQ
jgi:DNA-binding transcriptional regulator YdaS (Cro superfamily)